MAYDFHSPALRLWGTLSDAEDRLLHHLSGTRYSPGQQGDGHPPERVRCELLRWLLADRREEVNALGCLRVERVRFDAPLDLAFCSCDVPLHFAGCTFEQGIDLTSARFRHLEIAGGTVRGMRAAALQVEGDLRIGAEEAERTHLLGRVMLTDARIGRNLRLLNATLSPGDAGEDDDGVALRADRIRVDGNLELGAGFAAEAAVRFVGARIGGSFLANGARLGSPPAEAPRHAEPARAPHPAPRREPWPTRAALARPRAQALPADEHGPARDVSSLNLEGARVDGDVYVKAAECFGALRLVGASVGDTVDLRGTTIVAGAGGNALSGDRLKTGGTLFFRYTTLHGRAMLQGAVIGANLDMRHAHLAGDGEVALHGQRLQVRGNLFMSDDFHAAGRVDVSYARVDANWVCSDARFALPPALAAGGEDGEDGYECLSGMGVVVRGALEMGPGFRSQGVVRLTGIEVEQDAVLREVHLASHRDKPVLRMERADVHGDLNLERAYADGDLRLSGTRVDGSLRLDGAWLDMPRGRRQSELDARRMRIGGEMSLKEARIHVHVNLEGAQVQSRLNFERTHFERSTRVDARYLKLTGALVWKPASRANTSRPDASHPDADSSIRTRVDLSDATLGCIEDGGWTEHDEMVLDGCEYASINSDSAVKDRLAWLRKQKGRAHLPHPYEQLAKALRRDGQHEDARTVMRARENALRPRFGESPHLWLGNALLELAVGHGYRLRRVLIASLAIVLAGTGVFGYAFRHSGMLETHSRIRVASGPVGQPGVPDKPGHIYPEFSPLMYSVDAFLPIIELQQERFWIPSGDGEIRAYYWFHIAAGWICSTLLVVGLTGMVKKDP